MARGKASRGAEGSARLAGPEVRGEAEGDRSACLKSETSGRFGAEG